MNSEAKPIAPIDEPSASASDSPMAHWLPPKRRMIATGVLLLIAAVLAFMGRTFRPKPNLPVLGHVPQFQLVDQNGRTFGDSNLRGHVWVADFIFTHCTQTCPRLTARMKELARELRGEESLAFVSVTVDPENDTSEVLHEYAEKNAADARWSFLTGDAETVKKAIVQGFKMTAERMDRGGNDYDVLHGNWFILGDAHGNIRGYYEVKTSEELATLRADAKRLIAENARASHP